MIFIQHNIENVYNIPKIEQVEILKQNYIQGYAILCGSNDIPEATAENTYRYLSGIPMPYNNVLINMPNSSTNWDLYIKEQVEYFKSYQVPFVWYIDEEADPKFKEQLIAQGFKDGGVFRGVMGALKPNLPPTSYPWF